MRMPTVVLSSGLCVANFSSPHPFNFVDGTILEACSSERAKGLMLESHEQQVPGIKGTTDIQLTWGLSASVSQALAAAEADESVDVVLVPFPVMTALKEAGRPIGKARVIRCADRITKAIFTDKFCA